MLTTRSSLILFLGLLGGYTLGAQTKFTGASQLQTSEEFKIPKRHNDLLTLDYGPVGTIQIYNRNLHSFAFWKFDSNLKLQGENQVETRDLFDGRVNYNRFLKLQNKSYLLVREVFRDEEKEGITALEFVPDKLNFRGKPQNLFKSGDKVLNGDQSCTVSEDRSKFLCYYTLRREERNDKINHDELGFQVFDENLRKLWGGEFRMPYTEAIMTQIDMTLTDDGHVLMLVKVYENESGRQEINNKPNYHFEILHYNGIGKTPAITRLPADNNFLSTQSMLYEDPTHNLMLTGFFSKSAGSLPEGTYMMRLDNSPGGDFRNRPVYYEIPNSILKEHTSERAQKKLDKLDAKGREIGIPYLQYDKVFFMEDKSTVVIAEQYHVQVSTYYNPSTRSTTRTYDTYAQDLYVMKFDENNKVVWVRKIAKYQHSNDASGASLSFNATAVNGNVHLYYIDNPKNEDLPLTESPYPHQQGRGGFLTEMVLSPTGDVKRYTIADMTELDSYFCVRYFDLSNRNQLLGSGRKKRKGFVYAITPR